MSEGGSRIEDRGSREQPVMPLLAPAGMVATGGDRKLPIPQDDDTPPILDPRS
jgi:hypothetical protein